MRPLDAIASVDFQRAAVVRSQKLRPHRARFCGQAFEREREILQEAISRRAHLEHRIESLNLKGIAEQRQVGSLDGQPALHENRTTFHVRVQRHHQSCRDGRILLDAGNDSAPRRGH